MTIPTIAQADRLARSVLTRRLNLRPKETVTIETYPASLDWAAGFVREARRLGASPIIHYEDERSYWTAVEEGRSGTLGDPGAHEWSTLKATDVYVYFWGPEDLARRARLPEKVLDRVTAYNAKWYDVAKKAGLRGVRMNVARVTPENARFWGVNLGAWQREMFAASLVDPKTMARGGAAVARTLERGHDVRIRHSNGTDLTLALAGRRPFTTLGNVTAESMRTPFGSMANVPDGSVYVSVDESTADGTFVSNTLLTSMRGPARGGRFQFRDGRLTAQSFRDGGRPILAEYADASAGKDRPSFLEIGLNPAVRRAPGLEEAIGGSVTVGVGRNAGFGGKTKSDYFGYLTLAGAELSIDGRTVVRGGRVVGG